MLQLSVRSFLIIAICAPLIPLGCTGGAQPPPPGTLTKQQWQADLQYLARELPQRHKNAFHTVSRDDFHRAVEDLNTRIPSLQDHEIIVGMMQIVASVSDAHTAVQEPPGFDRYPLSLYWFGNELRVIMTTKPYERALGTRLVKVGGTDIADAMAKVDTLIAHENEYWVRCLDASYITYAQILHALKIAPSLQCATWTFEDDTGHRFILEMQPTPAAQRIPWISVVKQPPLYRQHSDEPIWFTRLPDSSTIYLNLRGNPDNTKYKNVAQELMKSLDTAPAERLVIDLRLNRGGDFNKARTFLLPGLERRQANHKFARAYVITGRATQSAAVVNAIDFRRELHATLVGEPTGGRPNGYSENSAFKLPNSSLAVSCSCRYYKFQDHDTPAVIPDKLIAPSWPPYAAARDPIMEWILNEPLN
jgi:hypothetical protein